MWPNVFFWYCAIPPLDCIQCVRKQVIDHRYRRSWLHSGINARLATAPPHLPDIISISLPYVRHSIGLHDPVYDHLHPLHVPLVRPNTARHTRHLQHITRLPQQHTNTMSHGFCTNQSNAAHWYTADIDPTCMTPRIEFASHHYTQTIKSNSALPPLQGITCRAARNHRADYKAKWPRSLAGG